MSVKINIDNDGSTTAVQGDTFLGFAMTSGDDRMEVSSMLVGSGNKMRIFGAAAEGLVELVDKCADSSFERGVLHMYILESIKRAVLGDDDDDSGDEEEEEEDTADEVYETSSPKQGAKKFHRGRRV